MAPALLRNAGVRRALTVPAVFGSAATLVASAGAWAPVCATADLVTGERKLPRLRALSFALAWTVLESAGVSASAALWTVGRGADRDAHYALQRWWAGRFVDALHHTAGVSFDVTGLEQVAPGPVVMCVRHTSIADALLPAWLVGHAGMRPRYVLKDDLLVDPCLDIVGNRLPNHFLDRDPDATAAEIGAIEELARDMNTHDAAVIYPEGTVTTPARRARAIERTMARDRERRQHVAGLQHLAPARPRGTAALLRGAPDADLVVVMHTGFEPLARLGDATRAVPLSEPIRVWIDRVPRHDIPSGSRFAPWFDEHWAAYDREIAATRTKSEPEPKMTTA